MSCTDPDGVWPGPGPGAAFGCALCLAALADRSRGVLLLARAQRVCSIAWIGGDSEPKARR